MRVEASRFLERADTLLAEARTMLRVGLDDAAGRTAYLAAFHAAQALIFERTSKVMKSHKGVHSEFLRVTKGDPRIDADLRTFLSKAYNFKVIADYETGPAHSVSAERAAEATATAQLFVEHVSGLIGAT